MKKRYQAAILLAIVLVMSLISAGCGPEPRTNTTVTEAPKKTGPSTEKADLQKEYALADNEALVLVDALPSEEKGLVQGGKNYIPLTVASQMDARFYWNETENRLFFTNAEKRYGFTPGESSHTEGDQTVSDAAPMLLSHNGKIYISADMIRSFGHIRVTEATNPSRILLMGVGKGVLHASVKASEGTIMRTGRDESFPIIAELAKGTTFYLAEELSGYSWTKVVTEDGRIGYVNNLETTTYSETTILGEVEEAPYENHRLSKKVSMAWHSVGKAGVADFSDRIKGASCMNVISPTWFSIINVDGTISSLASTEYVNAAHKAGLKVWALCDDFAEGVPGIEVLSSTAHRDNLVKNLVGEVTRVGADGINIDFEFITKDSAPHFLQFLRELYIACKDKGLTISTDNYYPNKLNEYYRLDIQKECVDYIIFMGYDEYHKKSTSAGPVASLSFVKNGVDGMLKKVPANQLILGVPFFSRKWTTKTDDDGNATVSSTAEGMEAMRSYVKQAGTKFSIDEKTGLNYAALRTSADGLIQIWLQDAEFIKKEMNIARENQLAGVSAWRLGYETKDAWEEIKKFVAD